MKPQLSKGDIQLIRHLAVREPWTPSELSDRTGLRKATVSRELSLLRELGLIRTESRGRARLVSLADTKHAVLLRNLIAHGSTLRLDLLLTGKSLNVLAAIHLLNLSSQREIVQFSGSSHVTIVELIARYRQLGAVRKRGGTYRLGVRYNQLGDFLREFRSYTNLKTVRTLASDATVAWERDRDVLFRSSTDLSRTFPQSSFSAFPRFGVNVFMAEGGYYFLSPGRERIGPEEVLVHAMLAADSPRERTLILVLMRKIRFNRNRFLWLSRKYGSEEAARSFSEYLTTRGRSHQPGYPAWRELSQRLREYR